MAIRDRRTIRRICGDMLDYIQGLAGADPDNNRNPHDTLWRILYKLCRALDAM